MEAYWPWRITNGKVKRQRDKEGLKKHEKLKNRFLKQWNGDHRARALLLYKELNIFMPLRSQYKIKINYFKLSDNFDWYYDFSFHIPFSSTYFNVFWGTLRHWFLISIYDMKLLSKLSKFFCEKEITFHPLLHFRSWNLHKKAKMQTLPRRPQRSLWKPHDTFFSKWGQLALS